MLYINLAKEKDIESALKKLKYKFDKVGTKKNPLLGRSSLNPQF